MCTPVSVLLSALGLHTWAWLREVEKHPSRCERFLQAAAGIVLPGQSWVPKSVQEGPE